MKAKTVKALAGFLALLIMAGLLSACSGESFGSRLKNLFSPGGTHDGVTTVRPPRTTAPETTTQLSEMDEKMQLAPDLPGAKKVIKEINGYKRVTYVAEAGNPYGTEAGTYLGEFKKEVTLEGKEVGGVALIPSVVKKLLEDALAKIPEGQEKWLLLGPVDISELDEDSNVKLEYIADPLGNENVFLKIDFGGKIVSIANTIYDKKNWGFNNTLESIIPGAPFGFGINGISQDEHHEQKFVFVMGNLKFDQMLMGEKVPFGQKVTETNEPVITYAASNNLAGVIDDNRILGIDGSPVFMIDK